MLLTCIFAACNIGPEFKRVNPKDPKSKNFIPEQPHIVGYNMNDNRHITINWGFSDVEDYYRDGFIVKKRLNKNHSFIPLDTLDATTFSFIDTSAEISANTQYRVEAFVEIGDSLVVRGNLSTQTLPFNGFNVSSITVEADELKISWGFSKNDFRISYFDGIHIEAEVAQNVWTDHETLPGSKTLKPGMFYIKKPDSSVKWLRFNVFILNYNNERENIAIYPAVRINIPQN